MTKVADMHRAQGDLNAAEALYLEALDIARALTAGNPEQPTLQGDLAFSLTRLRALKSAKGDLEGRWLLIARPRS